MPEKATHRQQPVTSAITWLTRARTKHRSQMSLSMIPRPAQTQMMRTRVPKMLLIRTRMRVGVPIIKGAQRLKGAREVNRRRMKRRRSTTFCNTRHFLRVSLGLQEGGCVLH